MICKRVYNKLGLSGTESECFHHMTTLASCVLGGLRSNKNGRKMTVVCYTNGFVVNFEGEYL